MEKEMEMEQNIVMEVNYHLQENFLMEKDGMEMELNMKGINIIMKNFLKLNIKMEK